MTDENNATKSQLVPAHNHSLDHNPSNVIHRGLLLASIISESTVARHEGEGESEAPRNEQVEREIEELAQRLVQEDGVEPNLARACARLAVMYMSSSPEVDSMEPKVWMEPALVGVYWPDWLKTVTMSLLRPGA